MILIDNSFFRGSPIKPAGEVSLSRSMSGVQRLAQCTLKMLAKISYKKLGSMKKENSETVFIQKIGNLYNYK